MVPKRCTFSAAFGFRRHYSTHSGSLLPKFRSGCKTMFWIHFGVWSLSDSFQSSSHGAGVSIPHLRIEEIFQIEEEITPHHPSKKPHWCQTFATWEFRMGRFVVDPDSTDTVLLLLVEVLFAPSFFCAFQ